MTTDSSEIGGTVDVRMTAPGGSGMALEVSPSQLRLGFTMTAGALVLVHVILQTARFAIHDHRLGGLLSVFSLGSDSGIPAYYSALAILFCAVLAFAISRAQSGRSEVRSWLGLAVIFAFLSVDEMLALHEKLIDPVGDALDTSGPLLYAWVIPYGIGVLVFLAVYIPFLRRLPRATAHRFVVAGAVFVAGAIVMEMIGAAYFDRHGSRNATYVTLQTVEEILEMAGIIVFIHALATFGVTSVGRIDMAIAPDEPRLGSGDG